MKFLPSILITTALACSLGYLYLYHHSGNLFALSSRIKEESVVTSYNHRNRYHELISQGLERAAIYEKEIQSNHLYLGMVANRDHKGNFQSECDSLLFSSLRYVALLKLGFQREADDAWEAIVQSQNQGQWFRHPTCRSKGTSRDMIVGLLAALSQKPANGKDYLIELIEYIKDHDGYIGTGPFHVSRVSPGIAEMIRLQSLWYGLDVDIFPPPIRFSFSTIEFNAVAPNRGYTSHLSALVLWLEYELHSKSGANIRSVTWILDRIFKPFTRHSLQKQRSRWIAQKLVQTDSQNLFFKWLQLKSIGALTEKTRADLLNELLAMPQFPKDKLPRNCDRKADYLWQRDSREYRSIQKHCTETFSGVDFLWMLAILSETDDSF